MDSYSLEDTFRVLSPVESPYAVYLRDRSDASKLLGLACAVPAILCPDFVITGGRFSRLFGLISTSDSPDTPACIIKELPTTRELGLAIQLERPEEIVIDGCTYRVQRAERAATSRTTTAFQTTTVEGFFPDVARPFAFALETPRVRDRLEAIDLHLPYSIENRIWGNWIPDDVWAARSEEMRSHPSLARKVQIGAEQRSLAFLRENLTDEQRRQWSTRQYFDVTTRGGRTYRITDESVQNVYRINPETDTALRRYCLVPKGDHYPLGDVLLMQMLFLKVDEAGFLAEAYLTDDDDVAAPWEDDDDGDDVMHVEGVFSFDVQ